MTRICVYGLGEAGSRFAADLVAAGAKVSGYDPKDVPTPPGVQRYDDPAPAAEGVDVVLTLVAAADATAALAQALGHAPRGAVYADAGTGSAGLKQRLAATAADAGLQFVDVALMTIVLGKGLGASTLASGPGAERYAQLLTPLGAEVECIGDTPGLAATRKLLRSVLMKGVAALLIEAMRGAEAAGQDEWLWLNLVDELTAANELWMRRVIDGTPVHALRRLHEMEASAELLTELGVDPVMTSATVESLRRYREG